jgi:ribosomal protein S12 methylthiotransferase accessory factor
VLIGGLPPWGLVAALALAAMGVGTLRLLDDGAVTAEDLPLVPRWRRRDLGRPRAAALAAILARQAPWCLVTAGSAAGAPAELYADTGRRWDLVLGAPLADGAEATERLTDLARFAHRERITSLFGWREADEIFLGPLTLPGRTACWNCCRLRLRGAPGLGHRLERTESELNAALAAALLGSRLASAAVRLLTGARPTPAPGYLHIQHLRSGRLTRHRILPAVCCQVCGGAGTIATRSSARGSRLPLPSEPTLAALSRRLGGWLDLRTGPISTLALGSSDGGAPTLPICAVALLAPYRDDLHPPTLPASGFGKGLSAIEAAVGAVGEAVERYSATLFDPERLARAPFAALPGEALDPRRLCLYCPAQYRRSGFPFARFAPARPLDWIAGRWLDTGLPVWVPAQMAYLALPVAPTERLCQMTSNGLAAGADVADAAGRALLELIERDAFLLHWLARRPGRRLVLDDSLDTGAAEVLRDLAARGARTEAYLLDAGLAIPTVVSLGLGDGQRWPGVTLGLGTDPDPRLAARKAILEHGQTGPYLHRVMAHRERPIPARPQEVRQPLDHALFYAPAERAASFDFLRAGTVSPVPLAALPAPAAPPLAACAAPLAAAGIRAVLVDVTSRDVAHSPFRVVRALATHLQPVHFGHGLERLANPRLHRLLRGAVNPDPHPIG